MIEMHYSPTVAILAPLLLFLRRLRNRKHTAITIRITTNTPETEIPTIAASLLVGTGSKFVPDAPDPVPPLPGDALVPEEASEETIVVGILPETPDKSVTLPGERENQVVEKDETKTTKEIKYFVVHL